MNLNTLPDTRKYDPAVAAGLITLGLTDKSVADKLRVDKSAICRFRNKLLQSKQNLKIANELLPDILLNEIEHSAALEDRINQYYLNLPQESFRALPEHIKIGLKNAANASVGTKYDKHRVQLGLATSISGYSTMQDGDLDSVIKSKLQAASKLGIRITEIIASDNPTGNRSIEYNQEDKR